MTHHDPEIEKLRAEVHCATLLERLPPPWQIDRKESTKHCLKYRRGPGEILIVNHHGRGWWDPQSQHTGDVFGLVQYLTPGLNFGQVRKLLREFAGRAPAFPKTRQDNTKHTPGIPVTTRWEQRPLPRRGGGAWRYLTRERQLPSWIVCAAATQGALRDGPYGSAWFAHHNESGSVTHVEIRGHTFKGSLKGGTKSLFRFAGGPAPFRRLVLAEAPIDALSLATIEYSRPDTLYAATGGGMGPATIKVIEHLLALMVKTDGAKFCSATDANTVGDRYAAQHQDLAIKTGIAFTRMRPAIADADWNDILKHQTNQGRPHESHRHP